MENKLSELSEVIKAAQSGDNGAIETLYKECAKTVFYLALKLLSNKEDAEDITQEVFIYVCEKIGDLKNPETFPAWLHRITTSKCNDFFRKKQVTLNIADEEIAKSEFFEENVPLLIPDRTFDNAETAEIITKIIDGLPLPQKVCIYYYYYQRMTITQIAETLNASESTIKNRLALAREKIRKAIEEIERKDGIKLYGALPLMLTPVLMKSLQNFEMPQGVLDGMFNNITANISNMAGTASTVTTSTAGTASTVTTSTAGTASTAATTAATASALGIKAIAAAIAGVLAIGGITTAILLSGNDEPEPETIPAAIVETEAEAETTTTPPPPLETTTPPATEYDGVQNFAITVWPPGDMVVGIRIQTELNIDLNLSDLSEIKFTKDGQEIPVSLQTALPSNAVDLGFWSSEEPRILDHSGIIFYEFYFPTAFDEPGEYNMTLTIFGKSRETDSVTLPWIPPTGNGDDNNLAPETTPESTTTTATTTTAPATTATIPATTINTTPRVSDADIPDNGTPPDVSGSANGLLESHRGDRGYFYITTNDYIVWMESPHNDFKTLYMYIVVSFAENGNMQSRIAKYIFGNNEDAETFAGMAANNNRVAIDNVVYSVGGDMGMPSSKLTITNMVQGQSWVLDYYISKP